ncbi:MAG: hypothetical protein U0929_16535 [Planctomycetaceae bacterium]
MAFTVDRYIDKTGEVVSGKTTEVWTYIVVSDDQSASGFSAAAACGWNIGDVNGSLFCKQVSWSNSEAEDGCTFKVTVTFDNDVGGSTIANPFNEPWEREWDAFYEDEILYQDAQGRNILNVVGDPYADPVIRDKPISVLSVTGNLATYNEWTAAAYRGKCNSDYYMGWAPGYVKCMAIKATYQYDENWGDYWRVTYQLGFNSSGWNVDLLEQGFNEINDQQEKVRITLDDGEYPRDPVLLDRQGKKLGNTGQPTYTNYQKNERLPFNGVFV